MSFNSPQSCLKLDKIKADKWYWASHLAVKPSIIQAGTDKSSIMRLFGNSFHVFLITPSCHPMSYKNNRSFIIIFSWTSAFIDPVQCYMPTIRKEYFLSLVLHLNMRWADLIEWLKGMMEKIWCSFVYIRRSLYLWWGNRQSFEQILHFAWILN